jgi:hypothetical protein
MKKSVLFTTKCWKNDWYKFLGNAFERKWQSCQYPFDKKWLMLNNDVPEEAMDNFRADRIINVPAYADEVLDFFNLKREDFKGGFWYSIAELAELYFARDFDYLCHLSSDSLIVPPKDWITKGIEILKNEPQVSVVSPSSRVNTWHNEKGLDQYFSDQGYLIRVPEFRQKIYNFNKPELPDYPRHGGNSFEKKVAQYLINTNHFRRILDDVWLEHPAY